MTVQPVEPVETEEERQRSIEMKRLATSTMLLARKGLAAKQGQAAKLAATGATASTTTATEAGAGAGAGELPVCTRPKPFDVLDASIGVARGVHTNDATM